MNPQGTRIVAAAVSEWLRDVHEAPGHNWERIRLYLHAIGHSAATTYSADGDAQWCGAFAGKVLIEVGVKPDLLSQKDPPELGGIGSTYRMWCLAHLDHKLRFVPPGQEMPGDILALGRTGPKRPRWGEHIEICTRADPGSSVVETIGGNAYGKFPDGTEGQGVIQRTRPRLPTQLVKGVIFSLRVAPHDFQ